MATSNLPRHIRNGWKTLGEHGDYKMVYKNKLRVDSSYQRKANKSRAERIAREFSWAAFGVISVALREDGGLYVFDGQHRVLAAAMRDDIEFVPCMVYVFENQTDEVKAFIDLNISRSQVGAIPRFNARLKANDPDALAIAGVLGEYDYVIPTETHTPKNSVVCVTQIERVYRRGATHLRRVMALVSALYGGASPDVKVIMAVSYLDVHLAKKHGEDITRQDVEEKLLAIGPIRAKTAAKIMSESTGRTGERVYAAGLVSAINKNKRSKRIKPIEIDPQ